MKCKGATHTCACFFDRDEATNTSRPSFGDATHSSKERNRAARHEKLDPFCEAARAFPERGGLRWLLLRGRRPRSGSIASRCRFSTTTAHSISRRLSRLDFINGRELASADARERRKKRRTKMPSITVEKKSRKHLRLLRIGERRAALLPEACFWPQRHHTFGGLRPSVSTKTGAN